MQTFSFSSYPSFCQRRLAIQEEKNISKFDNLRLSFLMFCHLLHLFLLQIFKTTTIKIFFCFYENLLMCLKKALRAWAFAIAFSLVNKKKRKYEAFPIL